MSDIFLGTFIWARAGVECCENVVTERLIADCYTAMEPPQFAISKFCTHVAELQKRGDISEAEVIALKCYGLQTQAIQPLLSAPNEYDYKDIQDVLEEIRQKTIEREKLKFDKERDSLENQIKELRDNYGITLQEFIKYRDIAMQYESDEQSRQLEEMRELKSYVAKADDRLKVVPNIVNAIVNVIIQIILCFVSQSWISTLLRIFIPIFSLFIAFALHFNWFKMKDWIKFRLVFSYKRKNDKKKLKKDIKGAVSIERESGQ